MATAGPQYLDQAKADEELRSYIFEIRYGRKTVPTKVDPKYVEEFLRREMSRKKGPASFQRARRVVDYYDRRSVVDHFRKMLKKREQDSREFEQSCSCVSILADAGDEANNKAANAYFDYLVGLRLANENYDVLVETLETLNEGASEKALAERLAREMKALEPRAQTDPAADDEKERVDQYLNNDLPEVLDLNKVRADTLKISPVARRVDRLCRIYAGWEYDNNEELEWWSARWIRRDAKAGSHAAALEAFRKIVAEVTKAKLPKTEEDYYLVRCFHAIVFLGGALTPQERRVLDKANADQIDILYKKP